MLDCIMPLAVLIWFIVMLSKVANDTQQPDWSPPVVNKKELRLRALRNFVEKTGARDVFVKRVGAAGNYLEHFMLHYHDAENSWQVRHVIRRQIPKGEGEPFDERYYWDDPVIAYEREVSAEISQAKQQLINDLDGEIHQLKRAIAAAQSEVTI